LSVMEARVHKFSVVFFLHFSEQIRCILCLDNSLYFYAVIVGAAKLQSPHEIQDGEVVITAEYIKYNYMFAEL
jgi:hypothetical protein